MNFNEDKNNATDFLWSVWLVIYNYFWCNNCILKNKNGNKISFFFHFSIMHFSVLRQELSKWFFELSLNTFFDNYFPHNFICPELKSPQVIWKLLVKRHKYTKTKPLFSWHYLLALLGYVHFTFRDEAEDSKVHDLRFDPNREQCQEFLEYCGVQ